MDATTHPTFKIGDTLKIGVVTGPFSPGESVTIVRFGRDPRMALVKSGQLETYLHLDHLDAQEATR